jgi:hypothetical protein
LNNSLTVLQKKLRFIEFFSNQTDRHPVFSSWSK